MQHSKYLIKHIFFVFSIEINHIPLLYNFNLFLYGLVTKYFAKYSTQKTIMSTIFSTHVFAYE
jgi:cytochrome c oxidase assembly factor CtaG